MRAWVRRVRSVLQLTAGNQEAAYAEAISAIDADPGGPNSAVAAVFAARAAFWMRDVAKARVALERQPVQEGTWHVGARRAIEAGIAALEGHAREAGAMYDSVLAGRLAHGEPFTHALVTLDAVAVLQSELVPEGAVDSVRAYLEELGAVPLLARLTSPVDAVVKS